MSTARPETFLGRAARCCGVVTLLALSLACQRQTRADAGELRVVLHSPEGAARPAHVEIIGLDDEELAAVRSRATDEAALSALFRVSVADQTESSLPDIAGRYAINDRSVTFTPRFPFDPGRAYRVRFDRARLGAPDQTAIVTSIVRLPPAATRAEADVVAIHPAEAVVPENLLRMYVEFSAPMGSKPAADFVRLIDRTSGHDTVVAEAFLPVDADFWSRDHRRYTLFLDPGRVKRGILPNRARGRPLRAGRAYALDIAAEWPDEHGQPLKRAFRHEFKAGSAVASGIDASAWRIAAPSPGTRDRLVVDFDRALDHAVAARALGIELNGVAVAGAGTVEPGDTRWVFVPNAAWQPGAYQLTAQAFLEDPQGNQIGRAFEVLVDTPRDSNAEPHRIPFVIGENSPQRTQGTQSKVFLASSAATAVAPR